MTVSFQLDGQKFVALNGGPSSPSRKAGRRPVRLADGPVRRVLPELLSDPDPQRSQRVMRALLQMKKLEIDALERAAAPA